MLPKQEAEDVIADYQEIVGTPPRSEEELLQNLGKPQEAVKPLIQPKQYCVWLAVFTVMTVCILALVTSYIFSPVAFWVPFLHLPVIDIFYCYFLSVLGATMALVWFRRQGRKAERFPKAIPALLVVLLLFAVGVVLLCWFCFRNPDVFLGVRIGIAYSCCFFVLIGVYSLIKARTGDRRWAAVYVLAVAVVLISRTVLEWSIIADPEELPMLCCAVIAATGLVCTGATLC